MLVVRSHGVAFCVSPASKDGCHSPKSFVTTRNPTLDQMAEGAYLGGEHISKDILETKIQYGESHGRACFGLEEETIPLTSGR